MKIITPRQHQAPHYEPKPGDFMVWYIPQIPMPAFEVQVDDPLAGLALLDVISRFSMYEFEQGVKPDYSDAAGVSRYETDGEDGFGWYDVEFIYDEDGMAVGYEGQEEG